jgi:hypothetical protein
MRTFLGPLERAAMQFSNSISTSGFLSNKNEGQVCESSLRKNLVKKQTDSPLSTRAIMPDSTDLGVD